MNSEKSLSTQLLLGAYAIAEFTTALEHLDALDRMGIPVAYSVVTRLHSERRYYCRTWWSAVHGDPTWTDDRTEQVIEEARAWITEHIAELDDLLESRRNEENR